MKSQTALLRTVIQELGDWCCTSTELDLKRIESRVKHEGFSFLTITLPAFAKDLQKGLDQGKVDSTLFVGYQRSGCLPAFLQGFTSLVFDSSTGYLLNEPNVDAIYSIMQICNLYGKVEVPCSDARVHAAYVKFIETEKEVRLNDARLPKLLLEKFENAALRLWGDVFSRVDREIYEGNIVPRHGPGATADRIRGNSKYQLTEWTQRLEEIFPHGEFLFPNWRHYDSSRVNLLCPDEEIPVRVISVPKTLKTPRIIAIEPAHVQYVQQGIWKCFLTEIERDDILSVLVGFRDQSLNQRMAQKGSLNGSLATLDLSEASDRVSNQVVRALTRNFPWVSQGVDACRSRKADVPGFGVQRLAKFASMGSALCFPMEAMVFMTIIFMAIEDVSGLPVTRRTLKGLRGKVRVYGDDLIVPVEYVHRVVELLEAFGLVVNSNKSFWTGKFRESCGKDYYNGIDITTVKARRVLPTSRKHVQELESLVSFRNQLYQRGLWQTCAYLDDYIKGIIPFPVVLETSPALGRFSFLGFESEKECPHLQRPLVKAARAVSKLPLSNLEDYGALLKCLLKLGADDSDREIGISSPSSDGDHLRRAGRPDSSNIIIGWVSST